MHVVVLAAAERGRACLERIIKLLPVKAELTVFTFPESPWEPKFVAKIQAQSERCGARCFITTKVHGDEYSSIWSARPTLIIVIGWRYLIPASVYESASAGCYVFHDSLLPKYRGFGPTVWALRNGETETGATLFRIAEEMDAGPIVDSRTVKIEDSDYIGGVMARVTDACLQILDDNFAKLLSGQASLWEQDHTAATYTCKNIPEDFEIVWSNPATEIRNLIRAYSTPYPGAYTYLGDRKITIFSADIDNARPYVGAIPGRMLVANPGAGILVSTGDGQLLLRDIVIDDGKMRNASELPFSVSATFGRR